MIYVKTHLRADERSYKSGVYYPREVLDKIADREYCIPGAFDVDVGKMNMVEAISMIRNKQEFTVIGFDIIDESLFLKVEAEDDSKFYDIDREVKIIISGKYEVNKDGKYLTQVYSIDAVSLIVENK